MSISWYPGHMRKAKRDISALLSLIDLIVELRDARIPNSSTNPDINTLAKDKSRIIILTKSDFADSKITKLWIDHFSSMGFHADAINCMNKFDVQRIKAKISAICKNKQQEYRDKKGINKVIRIAVLGIPNVGKSTFINLLLSEKKTKTEDKPGVTRGNQWLKIDSFTEILDTPGILWPKTDDAEKSLNLAFTGAIKHDVLDTVFVASKLIEVLFELYPNSFAQRYGIIKPSSDVVGALETICIRMGLLKSGGVADVAAGSIRLLRDFQTGKLGNITLEKPK